MPPRTACNQGASGYIKIVTVRRVYPSGKFLKRSLSRVSASSSRSANRQHRGSVGLPPNLPPEGARRVTSDGRKPPLTCLNLRGRYWD